LIFNLTLLEGCYTIDLEPSADDRGWFARTWCKEEFLKIGHQKEWLQLNHSFTKNRGTIRGMHFQLSPFTEIKLVRCIAGAVFDVVVDLRKNSTTFLQYVGVELSAENKKMIYIPGGFAHGFQALANDTELIYHHTAMYTPGAEGGIKYDDPLINIEWPLPAGSVSLRDNSFPLLTKNFKGL
jgi:dTDP-4-dehydrorhamnose 3,5-epimerase